MIQYKHRYTLFTMLAIVLSGLNSSSVIGQTLKPIKNRSASPPAKTPEKPANKDKSKDSLQLSGRFHLENGSKTGVLILKAEVPKGSYIYSLTQKSGPTELKILSPKGFKVKGKFESDRTPEIVPNDPVMKMRMEKHRKMVQFFVPIEIEAGVDPAKLRPVIQFDGQVCSDQGFCMPIRGKKVAATFGGFFSKQAQKKAIGANRSR